MDCHFLLPGIFPTQESNPGLPHCRQTLYHPSHQGSPKINGIELNRSRVSWETIAVWNSPGQNTGVGSLSLLQGIFSTQGSNPGSPHCRQILYQLSYEGSPHMRTHMSYEGRQFHGPCKSIISPRSIIQFMVHRKSIISPRSIIQTFCVVDDLDRFEEG